MISLLMLLLSQVTVSSTGIQILDSDVSRIMTPLTDRTGSFFNVIIAFAGVIIVIRFIRLVIRFIKKD